MLKALEKNKTPLFDLYLLKTKKPSSLVVVFPGGGYCTRAEHEGKPIAQWLNKNGISAVNRHPIPLNDAKNAISYIRSMAKKWNINPKKIGALGFSAGGHLVSTLGTHWNHRSCRPDALILCYPVISLIEKYKHEGSAVNLLGKNPPEKLRKLLSSEKHMKKDAPPSFLWHTADDPAVNVKNSLVFACALRDHNVPFELHVYQSGKHGLGLANGVKDVGTWKDRCISWLKRQGF